MSNALVTVLVLLIGLAIGLAIGIWFGRSQASNSQSSANNDLIALYAKDLFAGVFFSIYGLNDLVFMLFFAWLFFKTREASPANSASSPPSGRSWS